MLKKQGMRGNAAMGVQGANRTGKGTPRKGRTVIHLRQGRFERG